jgi:hypothetical protein
MSSNCETLSLADALRQVPVQATLALLEGAYHCAHTLERPPWDFALANNEIHKTGVTDGQLELLLAAHVLERRTNLLPAVPNGHAPCEPDVHLQEDTAWLVLSPAGAQLVAQTRQSGGKLVPRWDPFHCELWLGGRLVKQFHRAARNQEYVLTSFQEEGWPERLEIALPDCKLAQLAYRLRETVKSLNHGQTPHGVGFHACADGKSVRWQFLE